MKAISKRTKTEMRVAAQKNSGAGKSAFETRLMNELKGSNFGYESIKLEYTKTHKYVPDFILYEPCIIVEAKGLFDLEDRSKMVAVKKAYPDLDIRLVFQNANTKIHKGSKITYGAWAQKHGFKYASSSIPAEWLKETPTEESRQAFFIVTEKLESDR